MKELFNSYFLSNDSYELICDLTLDFLYCFMNQYRPVPHFAFTSWSCVLKSCNLHSKHSNNVTYTTFPWLKMTDDLIEWLHVKKTSKWSKCVLCFSICLHCIIESVEADFSLQLLAKDVRAWNHNSLHSIPHLRQFLEKAFRLDSTEMGDSG